MPELPKDHNAYETVFNFKERSVYCTRFEKDGYHVFLYYDMLLAMQETTDAISRLERKNTSNEIALAKEAGRREKGKPKMTEEQVKAMQSVDVARTLQENNKIGTLILRTNRLDLNEAQVYGFYKTRQDLEQAFKGYDDTLELESSYMQDHDAYEGWLFINHLALQMLYGILDYIAYTGLTSKYSFKDLIRTLQGIRPNKINGQRFTTKYTRGTAKLCADLAIDITDPLL